MLPEIHCESYQQLQNLLDNSCKMFQRFQHLCLAEGLPLLTIKSFLPFPYVDSNVDVVAVNMSKTDRYRHCIQQLGFRRLRSLADVREPMKEMYYYVNHKSDNAYPRLHLHSAISWNGVVYLDLPQVWERRTYHSVNDLEIPIPSPEDEILIMAAHAMFENKYITLHELMYLQHLTTQTIDWDYVFRAAQDKLWHSALSTFLGTAYGLGQALNLDIKINMTERIVNMQSHSTTFPWILPLAKTLGAGGHKLFQDLRHKRIKNVPRQIFTYLLVDPLWMYRKARRKVNKA
jgi:hypothetical protein